jgi:hypothetical protein
MANNASASKLDIAVWKVMAQGDRAVQEQCFGYLLVAQRALLVAQRSLLLAGTHLACPRPVPLVTQEGASLLALLMVQAQALWLCLWLWL